VVSREERLEPFVRRGFELRGSLEEGFALEPEQGIRCRPTLGFIDQELIDVGVGTFPLKGAEHVVPTGVQVNAVTGREEHRDRAADVEIEKPRLIELEAEDENTVLIERGRMIADPRHHRVWRLDRTLDHDLAGRLRRAAGGQEGQKRNGGRARRGMAQV